MGLSGPGAQADLLRADREAVIRLRPDPVRAGVEAYSREACGDPDLDGMLLGCLAPD